VEPTLSGAAPFPGRTCAYLSYILASRFIVDIMAAVKLLLFAAFVALLCAEGTPTTLITS